MLKLTVIVSVVLIGSTLWAASLSCDSCGSECAAACGTRHFRSCCFNYLRRKRIPDTEKLFPKNVHDLKYQENTKVDKSKLPVFIVENLPEPWMTNVLPSDYRPYPYEDMVENRLFDY